MKLWIATIAVAVALTASLVPSTANACGGYGQNDVEWSQMMVEWAEQDLADAVRNGDTEHVEAAAARLLSAMESLREAEANEAARVATLDATDLAL